MSSCDALSTVHAQPSESAYLDDAVPLRDYWRILVRHRIFICGLVLLTALATALFTLSQPNIYQSTATLMPLGASGGGLSGALSALGGFLPPGIGGKESPTDRLLAVLQSRTLAVDVIEHLDLLHVLFMKQWDAEKHQWRTKPPTLQDAASTLGGLVSVTASRQGLMTIAMTHHDAVLAATIANAYVDALQRALNENAFSLAKKIGCSLPAS